MPTSGTVRPIEAADRAPWERLWLGYQDFYGIALGSDVTNALWRRLLEPAGPIAGLVATQEGVLTGFAHCVYHPSTWLTGETCYLQNLFVDKPLRGQGIARLLIGEVYAAADARGAAQVYWLTHTDNTAARHLYASVASHSGFISYERFSEISTR